MRGKLFQAAKRIVLCAAVSFNCGSAICQGVDNALPLQLSQTSSITLDENERSFFKVRLAAGQYKVILDTRRADQKSGNIISGISLLDQDGGTLEEGAIAFNEIDFEFRGVHHFSLKSPGTVMLKVYNNNSRAKFWLTVVEESLRSPVPLFGTVSPREIQAGQSRSGVLDEGESAYYSIDLKRGDYKAVLDFANAQRQNTNIQGYLALLDRDGGGQQNLINLNEVDVSYRKTASFSLKRDSTVLLRVQNTIYRVNYVVRISATMDAN
jgi:hypothetical protein